MRKAFTLIELMVSISILSIIMVFLYKSYATLNLSNKFYEKKMQVMKDTQFKKKILYLDFSLALDNGAKSVNILNQESNEDVVFMQSSNSMHSRYNPFVAYVLKDSKLYRLESLQEFKEYPISSEIEFSGAYFGEVETFRVYEFKETKEGIKNSYYLIHLEFKDGEKVLLKVKMLNSD